MAEIEDYSRGLVKYTSRDYSALLEEFKDLIPKLTDLWKPEADSDPGMVLLKLLASTADTLGVNLDWLANELYAPSMTQRKNAEKVLGLIGYTLGFFTAAMTEVTFTNNTEKPFTVNFGYNGANFCTLTTSTDITGASRVITYNILPMTNSFGQSESRNIREVVTNNQYIFTPSDPVTLAPGESCTRVAIEGELRSYTISVADIKANNYKITLPSQHIDTTAVWVLAKASASDTNYLATQWLQCETTTEFAIPEPRFAITYDNYSNAQLTVSNYLNQLENYEGNYLVIYWIDCSGTIGCVGENVLGDLILANEQSVDPDDISISNLSNTTELPNTYTVTGRSPETAKEAYLNSRNYINTWDSLITLPDYNKFLNREPGVDCGYVLDCQKAVEINLAIYNDDTLTETQKSKKYITFYDFPTGENSYNWSDALNLTFDPSDPEKYVFATNFQTYTAMCFAIHNDFQESAMGVGKYVTAQTSKGIKYVKYRPPQRFIDGVVNDFTPLQSMSVDLQFGWARIFNFYVTGQIYTIRPVSSSVADSLVQTVQEALALYFSPANRSFGQKPTAMEVEEVCKNADEKIRYFDMGSVNNNVITYFNCDPECFNPISFARYIATPDTGNPTNIRVAPECIVD